MKTKTLLLGALISAASINLQAQTYFQHVYPTTSAGQTNRVCSAIVTDQNLSNPIDEYAIVTYQTSSNTGGPNFEIRKISGNGDYNSIGSPWFTIPFFNSYQVNLGAGLCVSPGVVNQTYGVSIIETGLTPSAPGKHYAIAGAIGDSNSQRYGCFVSTLNIDGIPINQYFFLLPTGATSPTKPLIFEDLNNAGQYYVAGSYNFRSVQIMYAFKLDDNSSTLLWTNIYDSGFQLVPNGMVQSPFNNNELIIVGMNVPDPSVAPLQVRNLDGFFMRLDVSTGLAGGAPWFQVYGVANSGIEQYFSSITPANSSWTNNGFAIGGWSSAIGGFGNSWMLKVDQSGALVWNTLISGTSGANGDVTGIIERLNSSAVYEYYGATSQNTSQMTVFKLDQTGTLYPSVNNEFEYTYAGGSSAYVTKVSPGSTYNDGIQVFGTDVNNSDTYMVKAYYNGASGTSNCSGNENLNIISSQGAGPSSIITPACNINAGLTIYPCSDFYIQTSFTPGDWSLVSILCSGASVTGGSNARMATGIAKQTDAESNLIAYPVPAVEKLTVNLNVGQSTKIDICIYNNLGQLVKTTNSTLEVGSNLIEMSVLDLPAGIYSLKATANGRTEQRKIIVSK